MGNKTKQTGKTEVYPFWYMKDIKNMIITHKAETITIAVISVIVISVMIGIIIANKSGKIGTTKRPIASLDLENAVKVEEVKEGEGENITLEVDTKEYDKNEEVAIITEDDGTVTIISTSDPKYQDKAKGKTVTIGKVTDKGIETTTKNPTIIDLSKKPAEEQKQEIVVTPKPEKPEESPKPTEEPEVKPSEDPTTTPSEEPTTQPSQTTKPTTSPSGTTTSKPSTSPTNTGNQGTTTPSNPVTPSQEPTTPSTPKPTPVYPTGKFVYKPNYSVQSQIISAIQTAIDNDETLTERGATVTSGSSCQGQRFTFRGIGSHDWKGLISARGTNYVYAEDEYQVMSDGSEQKTGMTYVSIYR